MPYGDPEEGVDWAHCVGAAVERTLDRWIPGRLMTAVLAQLDTATGQLSWSPAGIPRRC